MRSHDTHPFWLRRLNTSLQCPVTYTKDGRPLVLWNGMLGERPLIAWQIWRSYCVTWSMGWRFRGIGSRNSIAALRPNNLWAALGLRRKQQFGAVFKMHCVEVLPATTP